jgi:hypothetical protein
MLLDDIIINVSYNDTMTQADIIYGCGKKDTISTPDGLAAIASRIADQCFMGEIEKNAIKLSEWGRRRLYQYFLDKVVDG